MSFPQSLNFSSLDPMAVAASSKFVEMLPESSRNARPDTITRIRVETGGAGQYLNCAKSYLKFTLLNTTTRNADDAADNGNKDYTGKMLSPLIFDLSMMSCIKKVEWFSSSNLLESVNNYSVLAAIMLDAQSSSEYFQTTGSILGVGGGGLAPSSAYRLLQSSSLIPRRNLTEAGTGNTPLNTSGVLQFPAGFNTTHWYLYSQLPTLAGQAAAGTWYTAAVAEAVRPNPLSTFCFAGMNIITNAGHIDAAGAPPGAVDNLTLQNRSMTTGYDGDPTQAIYQTAADSDIRPYNNAQFGLSNVQPCSNNTPWNWNTMISLSTGAAALNTPVAGEYGIYGRPNEQLQANIGGMGANEASVRISRAGIQIPYGGKLTVCLPLLSMFGTLANKMIPLHALSSPLMLHITWESKNNATIQWTPSHYNESCDKVFNDGNANVNTNTPIIQTQALDAQGNAQPAQWTGTNNTNGREIGRGSALNWDYSIDNIVYMANITTINAEAQSIIDQMTMGNYEISCQSYRHFQTSIEAGQTSVSLLVPARFSSVKSLFCALRPQANMGNPQAPTISERVKNWYTRAQLKIGSSLLPPKPIEMSNNYFNDSMGSIEGTEVNQAGSEVITYTNSGKARAAHHSGSAPEAFAMLVAALGENINSLELNCNMDSSVYGNNCGLGTNQSDADYYTYCWNGSRGGFVLGFDLESFGPGDSSGRLLDSGLNTLGVSTFLELSVDDTTISMANGEGSSNINPLQLITACRVDSFALFQQVLTISGGVASVRF